MKKFILISVCDRAIVTEVFDSMEEATAQRNKEMTEWAHVPSDFFDQHDEYEESDFGFGKYEAWANDRCDLDWLIVEIPLKQEEV